jgi:cytoskeletal protein CcmA (bactofilin family)
VFFILGLLTMTTIGSSLTITGELTSYEDITVHGKVMGRILMEAGCLMVAPTGQVAATIQATTMSILGRAEGDFGASERIELAPTAEVTGTLTCPVVILRDGATFNGVVDMDRQAAKATAKPKPAGVTASAAADLLAV